MVNRGGILVNGMHPYLDLPPDILNWGMIPGGGFSTVDEAYPASSTCTSSCKLDEFLCDEGCNCIDKSLRCDGTRQCAAGEDEQNCNESHLASICASLKNFVMCPKTKRCISKEWLCDGDDDCGDYSDETHCGDKKSDLFKKKNSNLADLFKGSQRNCTVDQFQCSNGLCVPKTWICDNDNDCRDFSDELNCTKVGCSFNEFECNDGTCINGNWRCDHFLDCIDGSDEVNCDLLPSVCGPKEFQCSNRMCIKSEFKCDGDDDCDDWSDEDSCPKKSGVCGVGDFQCKSGDCIPKRWLCDNQKDCSTEEDEVDCNSSFNKTCAADEHRCADGQCILKSWVCDGSPDCANGEDESICSIVCDEAKFACSATEPNKSHTAFCIARKRKCDGRKDCPSGEDETSCPTRRECVRNTVCEQLCVTLANGKKACDCYNGYKLHLDGTSCVDIDECMYATDPVCSQTCYNTMGSFTCGCMTGYVLRPDLRTCKAVGAYPTLLFANRIDIRQMSLSTSKYSLIAKGLHNAISLDYHYKQKLLFWSDVSTDKIKRSTLNGTNTTRSLAIVNSGLESPGGIAVDWIHNLIFWTDSGTKRVEVASLDGGHRAIIVASELDKPRAIVVHPGSAWVFWSDWGPNPKIERCEMDGSDRKRIITESVFWPNGLTIDYTDNMIYWADAKHNVIEVSALDGTSRRKVITKGLPHPFAISVFEDAIFWTDWHTKSITTANKVTGAGFKTLHARLHFPMDVRTFHPTRQPEFTNRCGASNGGCQDLCLPNRVSFSCVCRMGQQLNDDEKTCRQPDSFLLFTKKKDIRLLHLNDSHQHQNQMVLPLENVKNAAAIAWDSARNYIFWSDVATKTINRAFWNGSDHVVIAHTNICKS
ncbi:hypothetical protein YQE_00170, partial [Dendroctonus ponderosae]